MVRHCPTGHWLRAEPRPGTPRATQIGECGVERSLRRIARYADAGIDHVAIRPIGEDLNEQFRIYLEEILPALNAAAANDS